MREIDANPKNGGPLVGINHTSLLSCETYSDYGRNVGLSAFTHWFDLQLKCLRVNSKTSYARKVKDLQMISIRRVWVMILQTILSSGLHKTKRHSIDLKVSLKKLWKFARLNCYIMGATLWQGVQIYFCPHTTQEQWCKIYTMDVNSYKWHNPLLLVHFPSCFPLSCSG